MTKGLCFFVSVLAVQPSAKSFVWLDADLRHLVKKKGESALLVSGVVLVKKSLRNSLVNLLDGFAVECFCLCLVAGFDSSELLLDGGLELALRHLVLEGLNRDYFYALLCGFDVRHCLSPYSKIYTVLKTEQSPSSPERVRLRTVSYSTIFYSFQVQKSSLFLNFFEKSFNNCLFFHSAPVGEEKTPQNAPVFTPPHGNTAVISLTRKCSCDIMYSEYFF